MGDTMSQIKPDLVVDTKGLQCPRPLLKAKQMLESMEDGQILEVIANDLSTKTTFPAYVKRSGDQLLEIVEDGAIIYLYVKKKGSTLPE
jgi:tRNA 2-thiouridine synthesizing protein A